MLYLFVQVLHKIVLPALPTKNLNSHLQPFIGGKQFKGCYQFQGSQKIILINKQLYNLSSHLLTFDQIPLKAPVPTESPSLSNREQS